MIYRATSTRTFFENRNRQNMTYGGGFQIRGKRDDNATQADPVYPHDDSTFLTVRKVG